MPRSPLSAIADRSLPSRGLDTSSTSVASPPELKQTQYRSGLCSILAPLQQFKKFKISHAPHLNRIVKLTHLVLHQVYQVLLGVVRRIGLEPANVAHSLASATGKPLLPVMLLLHLVYLLLHLVVRLDVTGA